MKLSEGMKWTYYGETHPTTYFSKPLASILVGRPTAGDTCNEVCTAKPRTRMAARVVVKLGTLTCLPRFPMARSHDSMTAMRSGASGFPVFFGTFPLWSLAASERCDSRSLIRAVLQKLYDLVGDRNKVL